MEQFATRCPHCQTAFRVTQAQLELRGGQVRCGVCRQSFNGLAQRFDHPDVSTSKAATLRSDGPEDSMDSMAAVDFGPAGAAPVTPAASGGAMEAELDALSQAIADLRAKPWAEPPSTARADARNDEDDIDPEAEAGNDATTAEEPPLAYDSGMPERAFLQTARRRSRGRRIWAVLLWIAVPLLTLALAAQLVYYFRNDIAAHSPQAARTLRELCAQIGCTIRLPMHLDQLSLDSSQLDVSPTLTPAPAAGTETQEGAAAEAPKALRLTLVALLRNRGNTVQAWPSIDLQLKGADGKVVVRKAFLPNQYLRAEEITAGMSARSEMEIRIPFELAGEVPASFEATLFYH